MYAVLLAIKLYAPSAQYITEDGVIAPEPMLPFEPVMTMVSSRAGYRALAWGTMNTAGNHAQLGLMDYGLLNTLQVDQHGNINSTAIGDVRRAVAAIRRAGRGRLDRRAVLADDPDDGPGEAQVRRAGGLHLIAGVPGWERGRARAGGAAAGHGAVRVVTPWAMYDYTAERKLRLVARSPWVSVEQILAECEYAPVVADEVALLDGPTEDELHILRTELDPRGQNTARAERVGRARRRRLHAGGVTA